MILTPRKIHMIGIAGKGMSALAVMLSEDRWTITGSDQGAFGAPVEYLKNAGITFAQQHTAENIPSDANLIVIGKHAKLTKENPEVAKALASGIPIQSFAEVLGELTRDRVNIVATGSYGKSTCASLLAWCLLKNDIDPGYFIGANPKGFAKTAQTGSGDYFVLEGDEYPTSNFDDRSKFLFFHPEHLLLTSGEHDHVTVFPTIESYLQPYRELLKHIPSSGTVTACIDNPNVAELLEETSARVIKYSLSDQNVWHAQNIKHENGVNTFELWHADEKIIDIKTSLLGDYNVQNIVGASALLIENGILTKGQVASAIETFGGVEGRLDIKNPGSPISVYESYGSSYTKAKSSIEALLKQFPNKKLYIIFEPHTLTWRDPSQRDAYKNVFNGAESVILFETPKEHGKNVAGQLSLEDIQTLVSEVGLHSDIARNADEAIGSLKKNLDKDSVVLIITSGEIGGLTKSVPALLAKNFS